MAEILNRQWLAPRLRRRPRRGWWDGPVVQIVTVDEGERGTQIVTADEATVTVVTPRSASQEFA